MANQEQLDLLKQGVKEWNQWRKEHPDVSQPDLKDADLSRINLNEANLSSANFISANLFMADLRKANLNGAIFIQADLSYANLSGAEVSGSYFDHASLYGANLSNADLRGADLEGANLSRAIFSRTKLDYAELSRARLLDTIFAWVDLSKVRGLGSMITTGPFTFDITTVVLPKSEDLKFFLGGTRVSDTLISYLPSLLNTPIQYQSCFISYAHQDETLAQRLYKDLRTHDVQCWFAPEDMKIGDKIRTRIDEAIHLQEKLLLLLSENAVTSNWVEVEVETALDKEQRRGREVLFPVRLDESVMHASQAWAKQLCRMRHIGDFTNWTDSQAYQQAFERLLRDLKKTG